MPRWFRAILVVWCLLGAGPFALALRTSVLGLQEAGALVETRFDPTEDHFLFFSRPAEVDAWVLPFLATVLK